MYNLSISVNDTVALSDSTVIKLVKLLEPYQGSVRDVATNCKDVKIVQEICGLIETIVLYFVVVLIFFFILNWIKSCRQYKAKQKKEKEDKLFSLRMEYQKALLNAMKAQEVSKGKNETSKEEENDSKGLKAVIDEYIDELRDCIKWIDSQKK